MNKFYVIIALMTLSNFVVGADLQTKAQRIRGALKQSKALECARKGDWNQILKWATKKSIDINKPTNTGMPLITFAILTGNEDVVNQLIELGADVQLGQINLLDHVLYRIFEMDENPVIRHRHEQKGEFEPYLRIIKTLIQHGATQTARGMKILQKVSEPLRTQIMSLLYPGAQASQQAISSSSDQPGQATTSNNEISVQVPDNIAQTTGMSTVTFNLDANEAITTKSYKNLIDLGQEVATFVVVFTQPSKGNWLTNLFAEDTFNTHIKDTKIDPLTRWPIKYIMPIFVIKQRSGYEVRPQWDRFKSY